MGTLTGLFFCLFQPAFHLSSPEKAIAASDKFRQRISSRPHTGDCQRWACHDLRTMLWLLTITRYASKSETRFIGALATATADTWATELGTLSSKSPRLITNGRPVAPGTSGGVTLLGMAASALGACSLGFFLWAGEGFRKSLVVTPLLALLSGMVGSCFDSVLGATLQAMYTCPVCKDGDEQQIHHCGSRTEFQRGIAWMNNDVVNFMATATGTP